MVSVGFLLEVVLILLRMSKWSGEMLTEPHF